MDALSKAFHLEKTSYGGRSITPLDLCKRNYQPARNTAGDLCQDARANKFNNLAENYSLSLAYWFPWLELVVAVLE